MKLKRIQMKPSWYSQALKRSLTDSRLREKRFTRLYDDIIIIA